MAKMKKKVGGVDVHAYTVDGVYSVGDVLHFPSVRDHEEPGTIHKDVYGSVVDIVSHQEQHTIVVSFADLARENKERDPGRALRRFLSAAPAATA